MDDIRPTKKKSIKFSHVQIVKEQTSENSKVRKWNNKHLKVVIVGRLISKCTCIEKCGRYRKWKKKERKKSCKAYPVVNVRPTRQTCVRKWVLVLILNEIANENRSQIISFVSLLCAALVTIENGQQQKNTHTQWIIS